MDENLDRPEESSFADLTLVSQGVTVTASVEVSSTGLVVVRPSMDGPGDVRTIRPDDPVEIYWVGGHEERTLRGTVCGIDGGPELRVHLAVAGPAERSQRRKAVRGPVQVPVLIPWAGAQMKGTTVDLSEGGMRALMDGWGVPPEPGTPSQVSLDLDDTLVHLRGEVVWVAEKGAQWVLALRFDDVPEQAADVLRRRVFQALREQRAAAAG